MGICSLSRKGKSKESTFSIGAYLFPCRTALTSASISQSLMSSQEGARANRQINLSNSSSILVSSGARYLIAPARQACRIAVKKLIEC